MTDEIQDDNAQPEAEVEAVEVKPDTTTPAPAAEAAATTPTKDTGPTPDFTDKRENVSRYEVTEEWSRDLTAKEQAQIEEFTSLPSVSAERMEVLFNELNKVLESSVTLADSWKRVLEHGYEKIFNGKRFTTTVNNHGDWSQSVDSEVGPLGIRSPKISDKHTGPYRGNQAVSYIRSQIGLGITKRIPLWHTGIWVMLKAPSDGALLNLQLQLAEHKRQIGYMTGGLAYSNLRALITGILVDFIGQHIIDTTLADKTVDIFDIIKINDLPLLVNGFASLVYPRGFTYEAGCLANPETCRNVILQKASPDKMVWVDRGALDQFQVNHMTKFTGNGTTASLLAEYQSHFKQNDKRTVTLSEDNPVQVTFKQPSIRQHLFMAQLWIQRIEQLVSELLSVEANPSERERRLTAQASITVMRSYQHYVQSIELANAEVSLDSETDQTVAQEQISMLLEDMTPNDDLRMQFFEEVGKFIDDSTIAVVATTDFECPSCHGHQISEEARNSGKRFAELVVIDPESVFFDLMEVREQLGSLRYGQSTAASRIQILNTIRTVKVKDTGLDQTQ